MHPYNKFRSKVFILKLNLLRSFSNLDSFSIKLKTVVEFLSGGRP